MAAIVEYIKPFTVSDGTEVAWSISTLQDDR